MDLFDHIPPGRGRASQGSDSPSQSQGDAQTQTQTQTIEGTIDRIVFSGAGGEFTVARLGVGDGEPVTIVGSLLGIPVGARLRVTGRQESNPRFGMQFRVAGYTEIAPATIDDLIGKHRP